MSIARDPLGLGGLIIAVGNDISSATKGSGVRIVAGKKRSPANPWATAPSVHVSDNKAARTNRARPIELAATISCSIPERGSMIVAARTIRHAALIDMRMGR
jgi:hypothetical protein